MEDQDIREALLTVPLEPGESFSIDNNQNVILFSTSSQLTLQQQIIYWNKRQPTAHRPIISELQTNDEDDYDDQEQNDDDEQIEQRCEEIISQGSGSQQQESESQNLTLQQQSESKLLSNHYIYYNQLDRQLGKNVNERQEQQQQQQQQFNSDQKMLLCSPEFSGDLINSSIQQQLQLSQQQQYQQQQHIEYSQKQLHQPPVCHFNQQNKSKAHHMITKSSDSVMISKRVLSDLYSISSQLDSIVYKTILDSDVLFQQAHNLKNNLLSPGQKQNPINLLMTIQQQSGEEQVKQQNISPTYQQACKHMTRLSFINPQLISNDQKMHFDLISMLARCKSRVDKFNLAQKGIVDYYKETVKGLRSELRTFATSLQQLQIQNARREIQQGQEGKNGKNCRNDKSGQNYHNAKKSMDVKYHLQSMPALESVRSEIEELLNEVTVERDLLKHQVEQQNILEQRVKSHYLSKLTNVQLQNNTMCAKYQAQIANLTTQVEKMSCQLRKLRECEKSKVILGSANILNSSSCTHDLIDDSQLCVQNLQNTDLRDRIKQLTSNYVKVRERFNKSKNQYEEQIEELENKQRRLQKENRVLNNEIQDLKSIQKYSPSINRVGSIFPQYENMYSVNASNNSQKILSDLRYKLQQTEFQLSQNISDKTQMRKEYEAKLTQMQQQKDDLKQSLKSKFQLLQKKITEAYKQKQRAENEIQHQNQNYQRIQIENQKLTNTINEMVTDKNNRKKELMQLEFDIKDRQIEASALQKHVQKLIENMQKKDQSAKDLEAEFNQLRECYQIVLNQRNLAIEKLQSNEQGHLNVLDELQKQLQQRQQKIELSNQQLQRKSELEQLIIKASMDIRAKQNQISSYQKQAQEIEKAVEQLQNMQKDFNSVNQQNQILQQKYKALEKLRLDQNEQSKKIYEENKAMTQKNTQITKKLEQVCNHGQILKSKYLELQNKEKKISQELASVKSTVLGELQKDIAIKTTGLQKAQTVIQRLNDESQKMDQAMNRMQEKIEEIEYKNKELVQTNSQLAQRASAGEALKNINDQVNIQNNKLKKLLEENQQQWNENEEKWESQRIQNNKKIEDIYNQMKEMDRVNKELLQQIEELKMQIQNLTSQTNAKDIQVTKLKQQRQTQVREKETINQSLLDKLQMLQKHSSKAFYHLISKFPKSEQNKFIRNNVSLAKMLQCIQQFQGMNDQFEFRDFLTADKLQKNSQNWSKQQQTKRAKPAMDNQIKPQQQQDSGKKMKKYAKILTTTKINKHASQKSCTSGVTATTCNREDLKTVVQKKLKYEDNESDNLKKFDFNRPLMIFDDGDDDFNNKQALMDDSYAIIGGPTNELQEKSPQLSKALSCEVLKLMNITIQRDFNLLSRRYLSMDVGIKKILQAQQQILQKQAIESKDAEKDSLQIDKLSNLQQESQEMTSLNEPKFLIIDPEVFKSMFKSTKAQMIQASKLVSAYKRENSSLKAMLKEHIAFLRKVQKTSSSSSSQKNDDSTANNSINLTDLIIPEIQSVRKQKTELIRSNQTLLSQLQSIKNQLDQRNKQLSQCTSISQQNQNLKKSLEQSKDQLQKLITRTMKRSDMVQSSLAVVYNLNSKIRAQISSTNQQQVPPLNIPIRKADQTQLITQVNELAKQVDSIILQIAVHRDQNLELSSKNKKIYEAAMRQLETEIIMQRRKVKESEDRYHRDLIKQQGEWQKQRSRLLDAIKNNAVSNSDQVIDKNIILADNSCKALNPTLLKCQLEENEIKKRTLQLSSKDSNSRQGQDDELNYKIKHLNNLLIQKNTQVKCLERQNQVLSLKCSCKTSKLTQKEEDSTKVVNEVEESEMTKLLKRYTKLQTEHQQLNDKYDKLRKQKCQKAANIKNPLFSLNASSSHHLQTSNLAAQPTNQSQTQSKASKIINDYKLLKQKKDSDKKRFKRRAREFESVLRLLELKMAFITSSQYEMRSYKNFNKQKLTEIKRDVARKNPNLSQWLSMMESFILRIQNTLSTLRCSFHWIYRDDYLKLENVPLNVFVCEMGTNIKLQQQFESQILSKCEKLDRIKVSIGEQLSSRSRQDMYQMPPILSTSSENVAPYRSAEEFLKQIQGTLNFQNENLRQYFESSGRDQINSGNCKRDRTCLKADITPPSYFIGQDCIKQGGAFNSFAQKETSCILIEEEQQPQQQQRLQKEERDKFKEISSDEEYSQDHKGSKSFKDISNDKANNNVNENHYPEENFDDKPCQLSVTDIKKKDI